MGRTRNRQAFDPVAAFENRAGLKGAETQECEHCGLPLVFALQAGGQSVSVDLVTILKCVQLAAEEHYLPPLDTDWWLQVRRHYDL